MIALFHFTRSEIYNYILKAKCFQICLQMMPTMSRPRFQVCIKPYYTIYQYECKSSYLFIPFPLATLTKFFMHMPPPSVLWSYAIIFDKGHLNSATVLTTAIPTIKWWCTKNTILVSFNIFKNTLFTWRTVP